MRDRSPATRRRSESRSGTDGRAIRRRARACGTVWRNGASVLQLRRDLPAPGAVQLAVLVALPQRVFQVPLRPVVVDDLLSPAPQPRRIRIAAKHRPVALPDDSFGIPVVPAALLRLHR